MYTKQELRVLYIQSGETGPFGDWRRKHYVPEWSGKKGQYVYNPKPLLDCKNAVPAPMVAVVQAQFHAWDVVRMKATQEKEEKVTNMFGKDERTEAQQARDYLTQSLDQTVRIHTKHEFDAYNLDGVKLETAGAVREALKNGFFKVIDDLKDTDRTYSIWDVIEIVDPSKKPDREGYDKAIKQMKLDASEVKDQIVVMGPEKGLEALNAFKAKTYH